MLHHGDFADMCRGTQRTRSRYLQRASPSFTRRQRQPIQTPLPTRGFVAGQPARLGALGLALLLSLTMGCAAWRCRNARDAHVIESRQLCQQGLAAWHKGKADEAETRFAAAIAACPTDQHARQRYAEALWQRGEGPQAIEQMREAVKLSGDDARLLVELGEMHASRGELDQALQQAELALRADTRLAGAWSLRGDILSQQGNMQPALESYHRALVYQPGDTRLRLALADIYRRQARPRRALSVLQTLADQYEHGHEPQQLLYLQGLALKDLKRYDDAAEALSLASRQGPPSADMMYELAETQLLAGRLAAAHWSAGETQRLGHDERRTNALASRIEAAIRDTGGTMRR